LRRLERALCGDTGRKADLEGRKWGEELQKKGKQKGAALGKRAENGREKNRKDDNRGRPAKSGNARARGGYYKSNLRHGKNYIQIVKGRGAGM